ncbi:MAG TPA: MEKHLA domain-containing protein [Acidocella sp.]|jgi:PAS domain-containing protein|uniref:MEKHLA domain-containing protein n=1 Tax=Acidocella sp. TaxID=50710 RepID=UPI002CC94E11|nr:MEKHLA domain-containing protein [Acidocella sp.]HVE22228.1 MEKHLA domain-containing protein [Acidocella sp.]
MNNVPPAVPLAELPLLILASYQRLTGRALLPQSVAQEERVRWMYEDAPFCVLAHNTQADPLFIYANQAAQRCFEYSWDEFLRVPSRLSAETADRFERQQLLDAVTRDGFAVGYRGLRVAKSGRRFWIEDGIVWQLRDTSGRVHGQAATFPRWRDE